MRSKTKWILGGILALLVLGLLSSCSEAGKQPSIENNTEVEEPSHNQQLLLASRIVDGDTFVLNTQEKVRLLCIDTPEKGEEYYEEAGDFLSKLILNKTVVLEQDISDKDRYDRLLRYVYVGELFVNEALVAEGYAKVSRYPPDTKRCDELALAENEAKTMNLGIWKEIEEEANKTMSEKPPECIFDKYNCGDFNKQSTAQSIYDLCYPTSGDVHRLDRDNDGVVCESLP